MLSPFGRPLANASELPRSVFEGLGGALSAIDAWTRIDLTWLDADSRASQDAVGYRGLTAAYRVAGLTLGDADAAPMCPPFLIEIFDDRIVAQVYWHAEAERPTTLAGWQGSAVQHWAAGSLTKDLRVLQFEDGDIGLEAALHLGPTCTTAVLREFVTAFSWDVAALHAAEGHAELITTEEWVRRAALSISRSTPAIPLREHPAPQWQAKESPAGVFCCLQPGGGLAESDNVLYAVQRAASALEPVVAMPGHRADWDYSRLTDMWLARDASSVFARTLLCTGLVYTAASGWRSLETEAITAVAPFGGDGFILGLHNGKVQLLHDGRVTAPAVRLARVSGRFSRLVTLGARAIAMLGETLVSARVLRSANGRCTTADAWTARLVPAVAFENVGEIDVDEWSHAPAVAVLGDDCVAILDAESGHERARYTVAGARLARWIGPGWLMVVEPYTTATGAHSAVRVLDAVNGRWTEPVMVAEITRLAVRGDEIHVGFASQSVAVWDRAEVCRAIGAFAMLSPGPAEPSTIVPEPAVQPDATGSTTRP